MPSAREPAGLVHGQQLLWSRRYGYADVAGRIPSTDRTLYRIASISKTFAATATVQLAERGKLSLEDPVIRHLEWFEPRGAAPDRPVLSGPARFVTEPRPAAITSDVASVVEFALDDSGRATGFTAESGAYRYRRVEPPQAPSGG